MIMSAETERNIYASARERMGYTQERASELIPISVRALSDYENGKTLPQLDVVDRMCKVYKDSGLFYKHYTALQLSNGRMFQVTTDDLAQAALSSFDSLDSVSSLRCEITRIAKDGKIEDGERGEWKAIEGEIVKLIYSLLSLKLCGEYGEKE